MLLATRETVAGSPPVNAAQVRMARAGLDWSLEDLAQASGVNRNMIASYERGIFAGEPATLQKIRQALEKAGVEFLDGETPGVRVKAKRR